MISMELPAHSGQHTAGVGSLHLNVAIPVNPDDATALTAIHSHGQDSLAHLHHSHNAVTPGGMHEESKKKHDGNHGVNQDVSKFKSNVWNYFVRLPNGAESECKLCSKIIKSAGNTTNLHTHIQRNHPNITTDTTKSKMTAKSTDNVADSPSDNVEPANKKKRTENDAFEVHQELTLKNSTTPKRVKCQLRVDNLFSQQRSYEDGGLKAVEATKRLIFMIAKDKMPYSTVEKDGFRTFVNNLAPFYKIPNRKQITQQLENKYEILSNIVKQNFLKIDNVALTTDIWTDTLNNQSYLGMTTHFIQEGKYKSIMICVLELQDHHTAHNIKEWLNQITNEWNIEKEKIVVVVADNAANIKKAVIDCFGETKFLPCFAHTLNLVPSKVFEKDEVIVSIIYKIKGIVTFFKHSVTASDALRKLTDFKLLQSVKTRWNSEYTMLERYLLLSDKVATVLVNMTGDNIPTPLMGEDLSTAKEMMKLLKPFKEATEIISGENYITGSEAMPLIKNLKRCFEYTSATTNIGKRFKKALSEEFDYRFKNIEYMSLIGSASILDPRYKKLYFTDNVACSKIVNNITKNLNKILSESLNQLVDEECENTTPNRQATTSNEYQIIEEIRIWSYDDELREKMRAEQTQKAISAPRNEMPEELRYYLSQDPISRENNPIEFWTKMPHSALAKLALRHLTVIATSVPSERLFSQAALILREKRNQLTAQHFQELLFLATLPTENWFLNAD